MAKQKKIGGIEEDVLITGGLVVGGYFLLKGFLPSFGVSDADKQTLDEQQTAAPEDNIFDSQNPVATDFVLRNIDFTHYDNSTDFYSDAYILYKAGQLPPDNPFYQTIQLYHALSHAIVGHIFSGNQDVINAALNAITNKYQIGIIDELFKDINGVSFWDVLRNGNWPMIYGLNPTDLAAAVRKLNSLPD